MDLQNVTSQQAQILSDIAQILLSLASVIVAAVLAYVTYQYYTETKEQTAEMRRDRESRFKPVLKATLAHRLGGYYDFAMINTGKGAAHDVEAKWSVGDYPHESKWSIPHFAPGDQYRFAVQLTEDDGERGSGKKLQSYQEFLSELTEGDDVLEYAATCRDALGKSHSFEEDVPLVETIRGRVSGVVEWQDKDELREIRKNIDDLEGEIKKVRKSIQLDGGTSLIRGQMNEIVRSAIRSRGAITVEELRNATGLKMVDLQNTLHRLREAGDIEIGDDSESRRALFDKGALIRSADSKSGQ